MKFIKWFDVHVKMIFLGFKHRNLLNQSYKIRIVFKAALPYEI